MQRILIIRHAEKPARGSDEQAIDAHGRADPSGLSVRGWQRAGALVSFFAPRAHGHSDPRFATPTALFAAKSHPRSQRPVLTLAPLAAALGLPVHADWEAERDEAEVLRHAAEVAGTALICWRHEGIHRFGPHLGLPQTLEHAWSDQCYDSVWLFARDGDGWKWAVSRQSLLAGDA